MPRIPTHQVEDEWEDDDFQIDEDDPQDRRGRRLPAKEHRRERDWEEQRREKWRKRWDE